MFENINTLSGIEFENLCQHLIENMGFSVETTKASGDGGIDLIAYNKQPILSGKYIIQCKRYSGSVGEPIIRDLYGVITSERANKGILITTGYFTKSAVIFAEDKQIELIDGNELNNLLEKYGVSFSLDSDITEIEQKFDEHSLSFRKSYNRFDSAINEFLFDVSDEELEADISAQYTTIRIYEAIRMCIYSNLTLEKQIVLFGKILNDMKLTPQMGECQSIYNKYLLNEDDYKTLIENVALPHDDNMIGDFWTNLMVASQMYHCESGLAEIIDWHKNYIDDLAEIINLFAGYDVSEQLTSGYYGETHDMLKAIIG